MPEEPRKFRVEASPLELDLTLGGRLTVPGHRGPLQYAHAPEWPVSERVEGLLRKMVAVEWAFWEYRTEAPARGSGGRLRWLPGIRKALAQLGYKGKALREAYLTLPGAPPGEKVRLKNFSLDARAESARHHAALRLTDAVARELREHLDAAPPYSRAGLLPYHNLYLLHIARLARDELGRQARAYEKRAEPYLFLRDDMTRLTGNVEFRLVEDVLKRVNARALGVEPAPGYLDVHTLLLNAVRSLKSPLSPKGTHQHDVVTQSTTDHAKAMNRLREFLDRELTQGARQRGEQREWLEREFPNE
jgi:hypothetical protein